MEVTPEMLATPLSFVCSTCGADHSKMLNELIRQQFSEGPRSSACRHHRACGSDLSETWLAVTNRCLVCQNPICPKAWKCFGYVCSARQRGRAKRRMELPVYEGQMAVVQARHRGEQRLRFLPSPPWYHPAWRLAWYISWQRNHPWPGDLLSGSGFAGEVKLLPPHDALLWRGHRLIRYDLAAKKERWSLAVPAPTRPEEGESRFPWYEQPRHLGGARRQGRSLRRKTGQVAQEFPAGGDIQRFFVADSRLPFLLAARMAARFPPESISRMAACSVRNLPIR